MNRELTVLAAVTLQRLVVTFDLATRDILTKYYIPFPVIDLSWLSETDLVVSASSGTLYQLCATYQKPYSVKTPLQNIRFKSDLPRIHSGLFRYENKNTANFIVHGDLQNHKLQLNHLDFSDYSISITGAYGNQNFQILGKVSPNASVEMNWFDLVLRV